jgi:glucose/arabinose dehydrogenase
MTFSMIRRFVVSALLGAAIATPALAYQAVPIRGTFTNPIDVRVAPGQAGNLYVAEQPGKIFVLQGETRVTRPFLDIEDLTLFSGEQGLLSFAFAPDYETSRRLYVLYVNNNGNVQIDEFRRSGADPLHAAAGSRRMVLEVPHPDATNHNGGQLHFGADGYLYVSIGDGGNTSTPGDPARKLTSMLGKILRINPLQNGRKAYQIPPGNPFVGLPGRDEIFAYGLRNPYRFALTSNLITIGDVGESNWEEVDILKIADARGANFGWPEFEGDDSYDPDLAGPGPAVFPIHTYSHGSGCAIVGGVIVTDPQLPDLQGHYLYGDFCSGAVRSFKPAVATQVAKNDAWLNLTVSGLTSFGQGTGGQIYMTNGDTVFRLEP